MLSRILLGLGIAALGVLFVWKTEGFYRILGPVDWAERVFGGGGTRLFYKLLGIVIVFVGAIVMTNLFDTIVGGFIRSLFAT